MKKLNLSAIITQWMRLRTAFEKMLLYANDMTSFGMIANVAVSHVLYSWVFEFGGKVKIKTPNNVRLACAEMLGEAVVQLE